jgi:hypothetical protein
MTDDSTTELPSPSLSLLFFLIVTIGYFIYRYKSEKGDTPSSPMVPTLTYFLLIVIGEFFINNKISEAICGESQWALSLTITLIPWVLIFALLLMFLNMFPSWKVPFSNTFGLFAAKMMGLPKLVEKIFNFNKLNENWGEFQVHEQARSGDRPPPSRAPRPESPTDRTSNQLIQALATIKLDNSIIINEFTEANFEQLWADLATANLLSPGADAHQAKFKSMIHAKSLVAEFMWFLLTGMLVTSVSYNYIVNSGCKTSLAEMQKRHEDYEEEITEQEATAASSSKKIYNQT